jgi:hypothetical protein
MELAFRRAVIRLTFIEEGAPKASHIVRRV